MARLFDVINNPFIISFIKGHWYVDKHTALVYVLFDAPKVMLLDDAGREDIVDMERYIVPLEGRHVSFGYSKRLNILAYWPGERKSEKLLKYGPEPYKLDAELHV